MKSPKEITDIKIKWNKFFPIGYLAMTFFGKMWMKNKDKKKWEYYISTGHSNVVINHEMIHVKQAVSTNNSWFKFYFLYAWYWLTANPLFNGFTFAYKMNPFEMEAYSNETDLYYIGTHASGAYRWKTYKSIQTKQLKQYWKEYNVKKKEEYLTFGKYLQKYVDVNLDFKEYTN